jgi:prepilin-type N-terminal cleavage/methylation domain-containing protein
MVVMDKMNDIWDETKEGVTLVEILVSILIGAILSAAVYFIYVNQTGTNASLEERLALTQDLVSVMDVIQKDVKNAGANPKQSTSWYAFYNLTTTLGINYDISEPLDSNYGLVTTSGEQVRYSLYKPCSNCTDNCSCILRRRVYNPTGWVNTDLMTNVTTFGFVKTTGTLTSTPLNNIRRITIALGKKSSKINPDTGKPFVKQIMRTFYVRNYKGD